MDNVSHLQRPPGDLTSGKNKSSLGHKLIILTRKEHIALKWQGNFYKAQHSRAVKRELALKHELQEAKAEIVRLKQRLFGKKSEKTARDDGGPNKQQPATRNRGQQPKAKGHGRTPRPNLPAVEETIDVRPEEKYCSVCGGARPEFFKTEDSEIVEVHVSAYVRKIRRKQYQPCRCERDKFPGIIAAPPATRLFPKNSLGISVWVEVLLNKFLFSTPTNRLCADFGYKGFPISQGTITGGLKRMPELFAPLVEAMHAKQMSERLFNGDETRWLVFEPVGVRRVDAWLGQ